MPPSHMPKWASSPSLLSILALTSFLVSIFTSPAAGNPFLHMRGTRYGYGRNIRPLPCVSKGGATGVCMFAWDCMKANGTHLGTCIDRFYFGSCCKLNYARPPPSEVTNEIPSVEEAFDGSFETPSEKPSTPSEKPSQTPFEKPLGTPMTVPGLGMTPEDGESPLETSMGMRPDENEGTLIDIGSDDLDESQGVEGEAAGSSDAGTDEGTDSGSGKPSSGSSSDGTDEGMVGSGKPAEGSSSDGMAGLDEDLSMDDSGKPSQEATSDGFDGIDEDNSTDDKGDESDKLSSGTTSKAPESTSETPSSGSGGGADEGTAESMDGQDADEMTPVDGQTSDGQTDQTSTDGQTDQASTDEETDQTSTDGQTDQTSTDGQTDQTIDGQTDQASTDGQADQTSTDGQTDQASTDGQTDQASTDGQTDQTSTDGQTDQTSTDGQTSVEQAPTVVQPVTVDLTPDQISSDGQTDDETDSESEEDTDTTESGTEFATEMPEIPDLESTETLPVTTDVSTAVDPKPTQTEITSPGITVEGLPETETGSTDTGLSETKPTSPEVGSVTPISAPGTESPVEGTSIAGSPAVTITVEIDNISTTTPESITIAIDTTETEEESTTILPDFAAATVASSSSSSSSSSLTPEEIPLTTFLPDSFTEESTDLPIGPIKPISPIDPFLPETSQTSSPDIITGITDQTVLPVIEQDITTFPPRPSTEGIPIIFPDWPTGKPVTDTAVTATESVIDTVTTVKPPTIVTLIPDSSSEEVGEEEEGITTTTPSADQELLNRLNSSDYRDVCGTPVYPTKRIVGGNEATFGEWPWQVSLRQWRSVTFLHKCGAALLNHNWAITAAHCVENAQPEELLLRLGEFDLERNDEPYPFVERKVQIVATHPQFDPRTFEYDLALLRFYEPVTFMPNILPICIPEDDYNFLDDTGFVTGWGRLYEDGPLPSVMQKVPVPVITNSECEVMYRTAGYVEHIPNIFICAGYEAGKKDSCEGDSGGPLVIQRDNGTWNLAGVISWGIGCALPNQPGVYTRISEFREWIEKIIVF